MAVEIASADNSSQQQIKDIEKFIDEGKNLIVVVPNVASDIRSVVEKAYDKGIPVILIDRKIEGDKFTAFIGADNRKLGMQVAEFIAANTKDGVSNVIELVGLEGSSPAKGRHDGFSVGAQTYSNVNLLATANADWNEDEAERIMSSLLMDHDKVDYVFAHNDRMAMGARKAIEKAGREHEVKVIGVDALLFDGGGVDQVVNKKFVATYLYPTGGAEAVDLAEKILTKQKFDKEISLPVSMVDSTNARIVKLQYQSVAAQDKKYDEMESRVDRQMENIGHQRIFLVGVILIICVLGIAIFGISKFYREKRTNDELLIRQLRSLVEQHQLARENTEANISVTTPISEDFHVNDDNPDGTETQIRQHEEEVVSLDDNFLSQIRQIIENRLSDSALSVNSIASDLGISRVQLYRKVKAVSDRNLNEIIRRARLEKAKTMLMSTNMTIAEVAFAVGFTSPSYFAKCYKDYFGKSPSELI